MTSLLPRARLAILPLAAALTLAACGGEPEETTLTTDIEDQSGGELIVTEVDPAAIPVDTPDTVMTPVPVEEASAAPAEAAAPAE